MSLFRLDKTLIHLQGNAGAFLNGLTSNTLDAPRNAFVNIHGRIVTVFDQKGGREGEYWALMASFSVPRWQTHVQRFLALNKTSLEEVPRHVYFDLDGSGNWSDEDVVFPQKRGLIAATARDLAADVSEEDFTRFRLDHDIPLHGVDFDEEFLLNVSLREFASFTKGCFLGQEPLSKVYNRSKPTWVLKARFEEECSEEERVKMTSRASDPDGRVRGFVFVRNP